MQRKCPLRDLGELRGEIRIANPDILPKSEAEEAATDRE
jgi:hypothetical protein